MKKFVALLAVIMLTIAVSAPAFAQQAPQGTQGPDIRKQEPQGTQGPDIRKGEPKKQ